MPVDGPHPNPRGAPDPYIDGAIEILVKHPGDRGRGFQQELDGVGGGDARD